MLTHRESTCSNKPVEADVIVLNDTSDEMAGQLDDSIVTMLLHSIKLLRKL